MEQSNFLVTEPIAGHTSLSKSTENSDWRNSYWLAPQEWRITTQCFRGYARRCLVDMCRASLRSTIHSRYSNSYISDNVNISRGNSRYLPRKWKSSTEGRNKSSEEWNETSEERNKSSEEFFRSSLDNEKSPQRKLSIPLWRCETTSWL